MLRDSLHNLGSHGLWHAVIVTEVIPLGNIEAAHVTYGRSQFDTSPNDVELVDLELFDDELSLGQGLCSFRCLLCVGFLLDLSLESGNRFGLNRVNFWA
ncbi:MAG: hypothetical protein ACYSW3_30675 [Planctomycetota bacterium]